MNNVKRKNKGNYLKCRNAKERYFSGVAVTGIAGTDRTDFFEANGESELPNKKELRNYIEPWMTALFQSEHFSLLAGAGLSYAVQEIALIKPQIPAKKITASDWGVFWDYIKKDEDSKDTHSIKKDEDSGDTHSIKKNEDSEDTHSLEEKICKASELLRGVEIFSEVNNEQCGLNKNEMQQTLERILTKLENIILDGERSLCQKVSKDSGKMAFEYLVRFLMSFASRTGTRERLHIFTTNYDRLIEEGADIAGLRLLDRFVGGLMPVFHSSRLDIDMHYNPPGIRGEPRYVEGVAKFTKLHGSLDWINNNEHIRRTGMPFGVSDIGEYLKVCGHGAGEQRHNVMIYPNSSKDRETSEYPYVDLFRDFAAATCRPNHTLVCYGYSFNDDHINRVIKDMLTISSTHLVVISLDVLENVQKWWGNHSQVTYLMGNDLGRLKELSDYYLPKPAIDRLTRKMSDLLKDRTHPPKNPPSQQKS